jgi:hypothetical protein
MCLFIFVSALIKYVHLKMQSVNDFATYHYIIWNSALILCIFYNVTFNIKYRRSAAFIGKKVFVIKM